MSKKLLLSFILAICCTGVGVAKHFWRGETMDLKAVCKKWGDFPFDAKKFRDGDEASRAQMSCGVLKNQKLFVGKDRASIRKELGDHDGYYFTDMFPAYIVLSGKDKTEDTWQLVFLLDRDQKISEIIMHKNCCN